MAETFTVLINGANVTPFWNYVTSSTKSGEWPSQIHLGRVDWMTVRQKCPHFPYFYNIFGGGGERTKYIPLTLMHHLDYAYLIVSEGGQVFCSLDYAVRYLASFSGDSNSEREAVIARLSGVDVWDPLSQRIYCNWASSVSERERAILCRLFPSGHGGVSARAAIDCLTPRHLLGPLAFSWPNWLPPASPTFYPGQDYDNVVENASLAYQIDIENRRVPDDLGQEKRLNANEEYGWVATAKIQEREIYDENRHLESYVKSMVISPTRTKIVKKDGKEHSIKEEIKSLFDVLKQKWQALPANSQLKRTNHSNHIYTTYCEPNYRISCSPEGDALCKLRHLFNAVPYSALIFDRMANEDSVTNHREGFPLGECIRRTNPLGAYFHLKILMETDPVAASRLRISHDTASNTTNARTPQKRNMFMRWYQMYADEFYSEVRDTVGMHIKSDAPDDHIDQLLHITKVCCSFKCMANYNLDDSAPSTVVPVDYVPNPNSEATRTPPPSDDKARIAAGWMRQPAGYLYVPIPYVSFRKVRNGVSHISFAYFPRGTPDNVHVVYFSKDPALFQRLTSAAETAQRHNGFGQIQNGLLCKPSDALKCESTRMASTPFKIISHPGTPPLLLPAEERAADDSHGNLAEYCATHMHHWRLVHRDRREIIRALANVWREHLESGSGETLDSTTLRAAGTLLTGHHWWNRVGAQLCRSELTTAANDHLASHLQLTTEVKAWVSKLLSQRRYGGARRRIPLFTTL